LHAAQRRQERDEKKRQRQLEQRLKEQAKLSAIDQARLEMEAYQNELEVLLSVHKEHSASVDWRTFASSLPPHVPPSLARHELAAMLSLATAAPSLSPEDTGIALARGQELDQQEYQEASAEHAVNLGQWERLHSLARRVLAGEAHGYAEAVSEFSSFAEISNLGASIHITVHDAKLIECELNVNGREVIPADAKSLTATGKIAVRTMPKAQFHELYQDYVCSCILRLVREVFALLPVDTVLITAIVTGINSGTGHAAEVPVLSLVAPREVTERLDYDNLDPSDSLVNFQHRGDALTSRKSGTFVPIIPLTPKDFVMSLSDTMDFKSLVARVQQIRAELSVLVKRIDPGIAMRAESSFPIL
jgi:hypothetical protein